MYNLSRKTAYLKSEIGENGRFWAILRFFLISLDFDATDGGTAQCNARGYGRGLISMP